MLTDSIDHSDDILIPPPVDIDYRKRDAWIEACVDGGQSEGLAHALGEKVYTEFLLMNFEQG